MERLNDSEVNHVADLARLYIAPEEQERYGMQLSDILTDVEKILAVEVEEEEIMISPSLNTNCFKSDTVGRMLSKEEIFRNVKNENGDYIVVPKVIND